MEDANFATGSNGLIAVDKIGNQILFRRVRALISFSGSVARGPAGPTPGAPSVRKNPSLPAPAVNVINFACPVEVLIQECGILRQCDEAVLGQYRVDVAGAKLHLPFDDVEPLFLAAVHVLRRPDMSGWLVHQYVGTVRVGAGGLDVILSSPIHRPAGSIWAIEQQARHPASAN